MVLITAIATVRTGSSTLEEIFHKEFPVPFNPSKGDVLHLRASEKHIAFEINRIEWSENDREVKVFGLIIGDGSKRVLESFKNDSSWVLMGGGLHA